MVGLTLQPDDWLRMRAQVERESPLEACGLLAGREGRVQAVLPVTNRLASPSRFVMEPVEQLRAFQWIEDNDLELLGIYHSHPAGPRDLSETDIAEAAYAVVHVIWSPLGGEWQPRAFRLLDGHPHEVPLELAVE